MKIFRFLINARCVLIKIINKFKYLILAFKWPYESNINTEDSYLHKHFSSKYSVRSTLRVIQIEL
jgi:hypothetical protein